MLPKIQRLPHSLRLVTSRSLRTDVLLVKTASNNLDTPRFGVVISKKIDKRAVVRNRMRRLLHQAIADRFLKFASGKDTLFIVQKPFERLDEKVLTDIEIFLQK